MTTTMHAAFLDDIIDHPKDDTPRLIYADWLQDHGEGERAEFLRVQVGTPNQSWRLRFERDVGGIVWCPDPGFRETVRPFAGQLPIPKIGGTAIEYWWRRGFIAEVRCPLAAWLQHGPTIAAQHPITCVRLTDREPRLIVDDYEWCLCQHAGDSRLVEGAHRLPREFRGDRASHPLFPTPEAAHAWASERAILWARGKLLSKEQQHER